MEQNEPGYPVQFTVDYPDQPLNRLSSFFRLFAAIPILVVFGLMTADSDAVDSAIKAGGVAGGILLVGDFDTCLTVPHLDIGAPGLTPGSLLCVTLRKQITQAFQSGLP